MEKKSKKAPKPPKKKYVDPEVIPLQAKNYANLNRTLRGIRK